MSASCDGDRPCAISLLIVYQLKTIDLPACQSMGILNTSREIFTAASQRFSKSVARIAILRSSAASLAHASDVTWFSRAAKLRTKNPWSKCIFSRSATRRASSLFRSHAKLIRPPTSLESRAYERTKLSSSVFNAALIVTSGDQTSRARRANRLAFSSIAHDRRAALTRRPAYRFRFRRRTAKSSNQLVR